jgi:hypothetical protein
MTSHQCPEDATNDDEDHTIQCHHIFAEAWKTLYCKQKLSDVTLIVGETNVEFKVHRLVLATHSDVMKKMLHGGLRESKEKVISLPDKDPSAFESLLKYFYTGCVTLNKSFICQMIELCDYYNVQGLKRVCCKWLSENLCVEDVCKFLTFSALADEELHDSCLNWLDDHITDVMGTVGFTQLGAKQLEEILSRDSLDVHEIDLFESLQKWMGYDYDKRKNEGVALLEHIRLPMMTPTQLLGEVQASGLVDMACVVKALTSLQPGLKNPYAFGSPSTILRLPRIHELPVQVTSDHPQWSVPLCHISPKEPRAQLIFSSKNLAVVLPTGTTAGKRAEVTLYSTEIKVPTAVRVQVISSSSECYRNIKVGFETNKQAVPQRMHRNKGISIDMLQRQPQHHVNFGQTFSTQQLQPQHHVICGQVSRSVATLDSVGQFQVPVGSILYFSLHITGTSICTQLNGSATATASLQNVYEDPNTTNTYKLLVQVSELTEKMTIAIRKDRASCCNHGIIIGST